MPSAAVREIEPATKTLASPSLNTMDEKNNVDENGIDDAQKQQNLQPIQQILQVIEHKIRNLEKRKNKLESYKTLQQSGKDLSSEQAKAVAKYDEVMLNLDLSRDFNKQFQVIANGASKEAKKEARKATFARLSQETTKIRDVLIIQETLVRLANSDVRNDFLKGKNGACLVSASDLELLTKFHKHVQLVRPTFSNEATFSASAKLAAEHLCNVIDARPRPFVDSGRNYDKVKELLEKIQVCGYFEKDIQQVEDVEVVIVEKVEEKKVEISQDFKLEAPAATQVPVPSFSQQTTSGIIQQQPQSPLVSQTTVPAGNLRSAGSQSPPTSLTPTVRAVEQLYYNQHQYVAQPAPIRTQQPIHEVIGAGNFFFLQDSELDDKPPSVPAQPTVIPVLPQPQKVMSTQTFINPNFYQAPAPVQGSPQLFAPPGIKELHQTAHIPTFQSSQTASPAPVVVPAVTKQIPSFVSTNPTQSRPNYERNFPPTGHFQTQPQKREVSKPEIKSADLLKSPFDPVKHEDTSRDWNTQATTTPPTIDTWTNETANTVPGNNNGNSSNYNSRPTSGFNRRQQSGTGRTSGSSKYPSNSTREGGYRGNNSTRNGYTNGSNGDRLSPERSSGGDTFYRNNDRYNSQNNGNVNGGSQQSANRFDQPARGSYSANKPNNYASRTSGPREDARGGSNGPSGAGSGARYNNGNGGGNFNSSRPARSSGSAQAASTVPRK